MSIPCHVRSRAISTIIILFDMSRRPTVLVRVMPNYTRRQSYLYTIVRTPCTKLVRRANNPWTTLRELGTSRLGTMKNNVFGFATPTFAQVEYNFTTSSIVRTLATCGVMS